MTKCDKAERLYQAPIDASNLERDSIGGFVTLLTPLRATRVMVYTNRYAIPSAYAREFNRFGSEFFESTFEAKVHRTKHLIQPTDQPCLLLIFEVHLQI